MVKNIDCNTLNKLLGTDKEPFLLDVREPEETDGWKMPNSVNIPLSQLEQRFSEIPRSRQILTVCASGRRSLFVAELLEKHGFEVLNLVGGMHGWAYSFDFAEIKHGDIGLIQIRRRGKGCLSYFIYSKDEAFVVDPNIELSLILEIAEDKGVKITKIFDTHLHADHVSGARRLAQATGASIYLNPYDDFYYDYTPLTDDQIFNIGRDVEFKVTAIHTPGHTKGSTIFTIEDQIALTGDVLFTDSVGRPDLAEKAKEFAENLYDSITNKILTLPDSAMIFPAHYSVTKPVKPDMPIYEVLRNLKTDLRILSAPKEDFIKWATENVSQRPPNYEKIIMINMGKASLDEEFILELESGPNRCSVG